MMKTEYRYEEDLEVDEKRFRFIVTWDNQLVLQNLNYLRDEGLLGDGSGTNFSVIDSQLSKPVS